MTETREETLHAAVCQAVALMNVSPAVARDTEARQAKDILREALIAWADTPPAQAQAPIDMVLHCPKCGQQHIDSSEGRVLYGNEPIDDQFYTPVWSNPPHRSHLCHGCGHIWRPADVPTNGVAAVKTQGKADSPIVHAQASGDAARLDWLIENAYVFGGENPVHQGQQKEDIAIWIKGNVPFDDMRGAIDAAIDAKPAKPQGERLCCGGTGAENQLCIHTTGCVLTAKPTGERVLLCRHKINPYMWCESSFSQPQNDPEIEYRFATLDSEEA